MSTGVVLAQRTSLSAQAKQALLVKSGLPKDWTAPKGSGNNNDLPPSEQFAQCSGISYSLLNENPPQVFSPDFASKNQSLEVDDIVSEFRSVADAKAQYAAMTNPMTVSCLDQLAASDKSLFYGSFPKGTTVGTVTVTAGHRRDGELRDPYPHQRPGPQLHDDLHGGGLPPRPARPAAHLLRLRPRLPGLAGTASCLGGPASALSQSRRSGGAPAQKMGWVTVVAASLRPQLGSCRPCSWLMDGVVSSGR